MKPKRASGHDRLRVINLTKPAGLFLTGYQAWYGHGAVRSRGQFFLGEVKNEGGWWYYFPVALGVKSTIPFLLLVLAATGVHLRRRRSCPEGLTYVSLAILVVLLVGMTSSLNIGVRHLLPIYPLLAIFVSLLFFRQRQRFYWRRGWVVFSFLLVGFHGVSSGRAHPDHLAYFNELAAGREHRILSDSNLDWGQDLARLARFVEDRRIEEIHLKYFGITSPATLGIRKSLTFGPRDRPSGWVAISITYLQGTQSRTEGTYAWLLEHQPVTVVGKTIWVYYLESEGG